VKHVLMGVVLAAARKTATFTAHLETEIFDKVAYGAQRFAWCRLRL